MSSSPPAVHAIASSVAATTPEHGAAAGDTMWSNSPGDDVTEQDSVRRECLDHLLILSEAYLRRNPRE